ncbi:MAG TPA: type II toxin-antitoxin system PemK/MazF family toxin [Opitutaceae bacterium]|jgi:mRNA-degrading endonuclease toxin of MazEF toxin-antitoxin module|nr:type II toxin-antitoxin system PemK/MazF family toxin [Opitutaceae bacterium]
MTSPSLVRRQWDVVKVRINPDDRDEHPAIIVSPDELCTDDRKGRLNVLYGSTRRPGQRAQPFEVILNGADGLEHPTVFSCVYVYGIDRRKISASLGRVTAERRRQIGRTIVATFRLPL